MFANTKEAATFGGRNERWEWKWSGEKIAGVIVCYRVRVMVTLGYS